MDDKYLPRLVTVGLFGLTTLAIGAGTLLKLKGIDGSDLITIGATGVGALAGFIARGRNGSDTSQP